MSSCREATRRHKQIRSDNVIVQLILKFHIVYNKTKKNVTNFFFFRLFPKQRGTFSYSCGFATWLQFNFVSLKVSEIAMMGVEFESHYYIVL